MDGQCDAASAAGEKAALVSASLGRETASYTGNLALNKPDHLDLNRKVSLREVLPHQAGRKRDRVMMPVRESLR